MYCPKFLSILLLFAAACAPVRPAPAPEPDYLRNLACRIVALSDTQPRTIQPLVDVNLDTLSADPADQTFQAVIHDGRRLGARVFRVKIKLPRDRFHVAMTLDGKPLLRTNHMDLDIYIETIIDSRRYALHCFPELIPE